MTTPHDALAAAPTPSALQLPHVWEEVFAGGRVQRLAAPVPTMPAPLPAPVPLATDDPGCSCHSCLYTREQELEREREQELQELVQDRERILARMRQLLEVVGKAGAWGLLHRD